MKIRIQTVPLRKLLFIIVLFSTNLAFAQEDELPDNEINIIKNNKKIVLPELAKPQEKVLLTLKPLPKVKQKYTYRDFSISLPLLDPKLKTPIVKNEPPPDVKEGFLRLGFGNYGTTLLDGYYNSGRVKDYAFGAFVRHLASANGPVDNSGFSRNDIGAYGKYFTPGFTLTGGLDYSRKRYNFYGYDHERFKDKSIDSIKQVFQSVLFRLELEKNQKGKPFQYLIGLNVGNISDRYKASESEIMFNINGNYKIKDSSSVSFFTDISLAKRQDSSSQNRSLWRIQPMYHFGWKGFHVDAGFQFSVDNEPEYDTVYHSKTRVHFHPKLQLQQNIFESKLVGYAGISGGMNKRTLRTSLEANPYLGPNVYLRHENQLLNFYFGVKGQMNSQWQYHTQISFETLANQAFMVDSMKGAREKYQLVYEDKNTRRFTWETEVIYDISKETRAGIRFSFLTYGGFKTVKEPWLAPHSLVSLFARQALSEKIMLSGEFYYMGGLKVLNPETAETETLKGMADLNLKGEYFFKKRFSGFLSAHNILNNKNQRFLYYPTQGFRIMVGATATF